MIADANVGRVLRDRYHLRQLLGQGSMGRVYGADDEALGGIPVAIKFLSQALLNERMRERFEREAKTCAQLGQRSIHIVRVTDYGVDDEGIPFYVMEYLRGQNLSDLILQQSPELPRFLYRIKQICLGLQCAHRGIQVEGKICPIVHRDIKPSNILVSQNESLGELVKILDFGVAKVLQPEGHHTNCFMGTLAYASPEQMEGRELDARSDIYSLGVMMFQMLTGKMPLNVETHSFGGWYKAHHFQKPQPVSTVNPNLRVPKILENLVMSCLEKSPTDRPQSVSEILGTLEPLEERFGTGLQVAQRIKASLSRLPVTAGPKNLSLVGGDEIHRLATWPSQMPIAEIVFPKPLQTSQGLMPMLWVMLPRIEILKRVTCSRYNQFLFLEMPHPMLLWLTVLYNRGYDPRWLPCYLDLRSTPGRQMATLLGATGHYRILFFAQEEPQRCASVQNVTIAPAQCQLLNDWAMVGQSSRLPPNPTLSKDLLKQELEKIKPQILRKLEALYSSGSTAFHF
ncbi:serine/threonine protein kinase [Leptolyngbya ohadii]|uniref:serine/threonine protein kinase n=1 Tax=Leptolyngbya ohadii TaxID=1962290 RepID=UPI0019D46A36|nr:serine/threonine-protein kinase [Leptolyngbya ohadii]